KRLHSKQNGKDFEILAVNVDVTTEEAMRFLEQYPVDFPVLEERSGKSQQAYELLTMPTSFLIDREGYIRIAHQGFNTGFIRYLEKEVNMLLQE
ncbi:TlpA disulfide reductase family protein, partial [Oleiphilus sp. HI0132]